MARKYTGRVSLRFIGNRPVAKKYIGRARTIFGIAKNNNRDRPFVWGRTYGTADGLIEIRCQLTIAGDGIIYIKAPYIIRSTHINGLAVASSNMEPVQDDTFRWFYDRDAEENPVESATIAAVITKSEPQPSPFFRKTPGKYSGEMRKVIQALISTGSTIRYDYGFSKTHGVYTSDTGIKWLIEISSAGVYAMKLPKAKESQHSWLGYTPKSIELPPLDEWVMLLNAAGMADFYSKSPFFLACGWAFNSNGSQASNTCYNIADEDIIYTAYLYTINIYALFDDPTSASISLIESGWFNFNTYEGFKTPDPQEQFILPFFAHSEITNFDGEATLYVYYRNDQLVKMRSYHNQGVSENHNDTLPQGSRERCGLQFFTDRNDYITYKNGHEYSDAHGGCYISPGFTADKHNASDHLSVHDYNFEKVDYWAKLSSGSGYDHKNNVYELTCDYDYSASSSHSPIQFCIIPLGDRESIYYIEQTKDTTEDKMHTDAVAQAHDSCDTYYLGKYSTCDCYYARTANSPNPCDDFRINVTAIYHGQLYDTDNHNNPPCTASIFACPGTAAPGLGSCAYDNLAGIDTQLSFKIYLSSALESVPKLLYSDNTTTFDNKYFRGHDEIQYMSVYTDSANNNSFFSSEMNGNEGSKYDTIGAIDFNTYPIPTLAAGHLRFWVGDPIKQET